MSSVGACVTTSDRPDSEDVARQVLIARQIAEASVDVGGIDQYGIVVTGAFGRVERNVLEEPLHDRVKAPSADVFGRFVHLKREFGDAADGRIVGNSIVTPSVFIKARYCSVSDAFGSVRIRLKSPAVRRREFDPDRQATLQFRDQIGRFGQVERARGDEQDVIGFDHPVLRRNGATFYERQQIALYAFARYVGPRRFAAFGDFVDFIEKDDAGLFDAFDCPRFAIVPLR